MADVHAIFGNALYLGEHQITEAAQDIDLIVNCTTNGQSGFRPVGNYQVTSPEPNSALGVTKPAPAAEELAELELYRAICGALLEDIRANHKASQDLSLALPRKSTISILSTRPWKWYSCAIGAWLGIVRLVALT